jgi:hypothetical protein
MRVLWGVRRRVQVEYKQRRANKQTTYARMRAFAGFIIKAAKVHEVYDSSECGLVASRKPA